MTLTSKPRIDSLRGIEILEPWKPQKSVPRRTWKRRREKRWREVKKKRKDDGEKANELIKLLARLEG